MRKRSLDPAPRTPPRRRLMLAAALLLCAGGPAAGADGGARAPGADRTLDAARPSIELPVSAFAVEQPSAKRFVRVTVAAVVNPGRARHSRILAERDFSAAGMMAGSLPRPSKLDGAADPAMPKRRRARNVLFGRSVRTAKRRPLRN